MGLGGGQANSFSSVISSGPSNALSHSSAVIISGDSARIATVDRLGVSLAKWSRKSSNAFLASFLVMPFSLTPIFRTEMQISAI